MAHASYYVYSFRTDICINVVSIVTSSLGRLKTFRRELMVDDEEGAGLELETVTWMTQGHRK